MAEARRRSERHGDGFASLEVILQIQRLGDHFCGANGAPEPPPSISRAAVKIPPPQIMILQTSLKFHLKKKKKHDRWEPEYEIKIEKKNNIRIMQTPLFEYYKCKMYSCTRFFQKFLFSLRHPQVTPQLKQRHIRPYFSNLKASFSDPFRLPHHKKQLPKFSLPPPLFLRL